MFNIYKRNLKTELDWFSTFAAFSIKKIQREGLGDEKKTNSSAVVFAHSSGFFLTIESVLVEDE